MVKKLSIV